MANNTTIDETSFDSTEISLPRSVRFWILLLFDILSLACAFYLLFHLCFSRLLRQSIGNHVIIILLILGLTTQCIDVPLYLSFILHDGYVQPALPVTCLVWWFAAFGMYNGGTILMAWAAIERHFIVFHYRLISNQRGRFFSHYLPLTFLLLYIFIFYIYVLFIFPCEESYEYRLPICNAYPCYQEDAFLGMWEFIMNNIVPSVFVAVFSVALLIRVIRQKRRLHQHVQWHRQRRMIIQLVAISVLNIVINVPLNIVSLARLCGLPANYGVEAQQYFYFSCYFLIFLFPFVCLFAYPEIWKKGPLKNCCHKFRPTTGVVQKFSMTNGPGY